MALRQLQKALPGHPSKAEASDAGRLQGRRDNSSHSLYLWLRTGQAAYGADTVVPAFPGHSQQAQGCTQEGAQAKHSNMSSLIARPQWF